MLFLKYQRQLKRLFLGPGTLEATAYRKEVIWPEETVTYLPQIYLDGQIERVVGSPIESTRDQEVERATKLTAYHAPTIAYHLKEVAVIDGSVYSGRLRFFVGDFKAPSSVEPADFNRAALVSTFYGVRYFGHWLRDDCTHWLLAKEFNLPQLGFPGTSGIHVESYKALFDQVLTPTIRAHVKHLTIFSDHDQNGKRRQLYEQLRDIVAARYARGARRSLVYLKRGNSGAPRKIQNEAEIIEKLTRNGFKILDTALLSLDQLLGALVNARLIVSLEGSHIAHCVCSIPSDSGLLVLQPPDRFAANHRLWTNCLGIRSGFVVGKMSEAGYHFDLVEILQTIDLLERAIG
jgi:hypothetical protein